VAPKVQEEERGFGAHGVTEEECKLDNACASVMT